MSWARLRSWPLAGVLLNGERAGLILVLALWCFSGSTRGLMSTLQGCGNPARLGDHKHQFRQPLGISAFQGQQLLFAHVQFGGEGRGAQAALFAGFPQTGAKSGQRGCVFAHVGCVVGIIVTWIITSQQACRKLWRALEQPLSQLIIVFKMGDTGFEPVTPSV